MIWRIEAGAQLLRPFKADALYWGANLSLAFCYNVQASFVAGLCERLEEGRFAMESA